ncbi:MCE family protein [Streptomyces sp. WAC05374]|uniref:MCE family protein n=1 Tax=Streptomyces sp. WAC05374 TaxID=2487420 RepID=UPI000F88ED5B|nr:MCE family protein [Streptomyces sp. WAC05374]RST05762.1 MCE family protein [Streptomyces sp. WAC05374]TDF45961.1 MCE family protein [Streptomyces sp. WAC05374]TDF52955.1 MCE family protein [Streptomyces sp. WAC05374]TDF58169.1 MCE family protein [Streptomyces sp. WAC05374]
MNTTTLRRRLAGVVFLLVPVLLARLAVAVYDKEFSRDATVTVLTGSAGNEMHRGAEVKLRGVVIGDVRDIRADGTGARLTLAIDPRHLGRVPADVTAQMLPTTLFGERFVALVPPARDPSPRALTAGATIPQDRSANAVELEQVLDQVLPLLTAVKPEKLSATLTAVAQALEGRGEQLGDTLVTLEAHLKRLNPHLPALNRDITHLVEVGRAYGDAAPDILDALTDFTTTSGTLAAEQDRLARLYGTTTVSAQDLTAFLRAHRAHLIRLSATSRPTLELLARHSSSFPCTLRTLAGFVPAMDKALGKGTGRPGLHVSVRTVPSRGAYLPGKDRPVYEATGGPHCYAVPYTGKPLADPRAAGQRLGLPNSPQENQLVTELIAPGLRAAPQSLPDWSTVLTGPLFRGAEVTLQ